MKLIQILVVTSAFILSGQAFAGTPGATGAVIGPLNMIGITGFDHDRDPGTDPDPNYVAFLFEVGAESHEGDFDGNEIRYSDECVEAPYIAPIWLDMDANADMAKLVYSSANAAFLSYMDVVISYKVDAQGYCILEGFTIVYQFCVLQLHKKGSFGCLFCW